MNNISFLIGSGFSVPARYPTTSKINKRLAKIDPSEIAIHSELSAYFLNGENGINFSRENKEKRQFVHEFLEFYNKDILESSESFHYEKFYDYYTSNIINPNDASLNEFLNSFRIKYHLNNTTNLLFEFGLTFNQLIADLINKNIRNSSNANEVIGEYKQFFSLLKEISADHAVHFYTLNHDLLLEELSCYNPIDDKLDDGFEYEKTPYFGEKYINTQKVISSFPYFTNKYEKQFRLYKLHGSIDYYWFKDTSSTNLVRVNRGFSHNYMFKHIQVDGKSEIIDYTGNIHPEFLSGTTYKIRQYSKGIYYPKVFEHFENNLINSQILIIIGYGFGDAEINKYIETKFTSGEEKKLIIIDISEPKVGFIKSNNTVFLDGGISGFDLKKSLKFINK